MKGPARPWNTPVEREKQHNLLINFLTTGRGIAFNQLFAMTEYPSDVLPLYSQGYSLARFLIAQRGKPHFIRYVGDGMQWNDWGRATHVHYGYKDLSELQLTWLDWVKRGSPPIQPPATLIAEPTAPPSTAVAVATVPVSSGWYSRVRDRTQAMRDGSPGQAAPSVRPHDAVVEAPSSVARQQPIERPQAQVLEWIHDQPAAPAAPFPPIQDTVVRHASPSLVPIPTGRTMLR